MRQKVSVVLGDSGLTGSLICPPDFGFPLSCRSCMNHTLQCCCTKQSPSEGRGFYLAFVITSIPTGGAYGKKTRTQQREHTHANTPNMTCKSLNRCTQLFSLGVWISATTRQESWDQPSKHCGEKEWLAVSTGGGVGAGRYGFRGEQ